MSCVLTNAIPVKQFSRTAAESILDEKESNAHCVKVVDDPLNITTMLGDLMKFEYPASKLLTP